jgi:outer membrane protein assembly factor BamB
VSTRPAALAVVLLAAAAASADDWPHWMGPHRDNTWRETGVIDKFPAGGPKVVWRSTVAGGFAGPSVSGGKVFVTDYVTQGNPELPNFERTETVSGMERVLCFEQATGKPLWKHEYPVKYTVSYPAGPRCTPAVDGGKVYTLGTEGNLFCLDAATGKPVWDKDLKAVYKTKSPLWGYAAHPLIDGKKLITLAGGAGTHVVALDKDTGAELWRAGTQEETGYAPPVILDAGGKRQLVVTGPARVYALDPETGKEYWGVPFKADNGAAIMTPVRSGDHLFIGAYSDKHMLLKLAADKPGAEAVFRDKNKAGISPVNVQPFVQDGVLYGYHEDGELFAVEVATGKRLWTGTGPLPERKRESGTAFINKQGDRYWLFAETGELVIAKLTPTGYEELDRAKVIAPTYKAMGRTVVWCPPAFAGKRMYVRNDKELVCVELGR